ncbi:hypothetical protein JK386_16740 [Nocardioides sp. zg-536]|uniref:Uncharacterized protein n=1 Tax=Nocardioides faecalis TaxID=2803858 RepID=A0A938Y459_9ACTN|nr:hypothetical protein [Nocardioides faecalis]MBM9461551.1 hypothetical protein [Nocardioides faecalis]QVI60772.1 hypothetical protein KG111_12165 [Nocardioides faecalis]
MASYRTHTLRRAALQGAAAGLVGVAAMTVGEKLEQRITGRPNSYVPARALLALTGRPVCDTVRPAGWNHAMHWGTGAAVGALRGIWSVTGLRGPQASAAHTIVRLAFDQTVENATGAGAPPAAWPAAERRLDLLHKTVYSLTTGLVADRWIGPALAPDRGARSL